LKIGLVDANEGCRAENPGITSLVGRWLKWEFDRAGVSFHANPAVCDIIMLIYAGNIRYVDMTRKALKRVKVEPERRKRNRKPFIITGGTVGTIPFLAAERADAIVLGEGYEFVRMLLEKINSGSSLDGVVKMISEYESAILATDLDEMERESGRSWMLVKEPAKKYRYSTYVDWDVPPVRGDDKVVRVIGSKGCKGNCLFCMTSWSQLYAENPDSDTALRRLRELAKTHRVQLLTNDVGRISFAQDIDVRLDSQSLSVAGIRAGIGLEHIARFKVGIARFGVEGVSERIRQAVLKPISNELLLDILAKASRLRLGTGLFYISGLPYEDDRDWEEMRDIYWEIANTVTFGLCRIKLTAYTPSPPSPLGRFIGEIENSDRRVGEFLSWVAENKASRHLLLMQGTRGEGHRRNIAEGLGIPDEDVVLDYDGVFDLIPRREDAGRAIWEIIQWKIPPERRWDYAENYKKRLLR